METNICHIFWKGERVTIQLIVVQQPKMFLCDNPILMDITDTKWILVDFPWLYNIQTIDFNSSSLNSSILNNLVIYYFFILLGKSLENASERKWSKSVSCSVMSVSLFYLWPHGSSGLPSSSVYAIFQARILAWVVISYARGSSQLRDWTQVSCIAGVSLSSEAPWKTPQKMQG